MPTKKGRGRPKGSQAKKFQESVHSILNSCMNPSKIVEVGLDSEEPQDAGMVTIIPGSDFSFYYFIQFIFPPVYKYS